MHLDQKKETLFNFLNKKSILLKIKLNKVAKTDLLFALLGPFLAFIFGLCLIFSVMGAGDGGWILYAQEIISGKKMYSELKMTAQPIFPLINTLTISIFGSSLVGQKFIFVIILVTYIHSLYLVVSLINANQLYKLIIFIGTFFVSIHFEAYRFDDYHVLANSFVMYSIFYSCRYLSTNKIIQLVPFGLLSTLTFLTRVNQGLAVILSFGFILLISNNTSVVKLKNLAVVVSISLATFFLLIWSTGDSLQAWFQSTISHASSAKGGLALIHYPWKLLGHCFGHIEANLKIHFYWVTLFYFAVIASVVLDRQKKIISLPKINIIICLAGLFFLMNIFKTHNLILEGTPYIILTVYSISVYQLLKLVLNKFFQTKKSNPITSIIVFPVFLFFFSSISSGGYFFGAYFESSISLLVLILIFRNPYERVSFLLISYLIILGITGFLFRFNNPYSWHSYRTPPLFSNDLIYKNDKKLGPHIISKSLHDHIFPVCEIVGPQSATLLSLPFSFANYYCGHPVWNGYVQTFFDTSTRADIERLISDLTKSPPQFVFYQRQLVNLKDHENLFNSGWPLPHRSLDEFIMNKIASGEWTVNYRSGFAPPSDWILITTNQDKK
jgi:hypothetical protein